MSHVKIFQQKVLSDTPLLVQCCVYEVSNKYLLVTQMESSFKFISYKFKFNGLKYKII